MSLPRTGRSEARRASDRRRLIVAERQKVTRQIKRLRRHLASSSPADAGPVARELEDARIMLNYIVHYPSVAPFSGRGMADTAGRQERGQIHLPLPFDRQGQGPGAR